MKARTLPSSPTLAAHGELQAAFDHYNRELFDGALPACLITMQRQKRTYGYFSAQRFVRHDGENTIDEIAMNPAFFAVVPLVEVMQTIVHEMCHAWQHHFGKPGRRTYHNKEWADKMESVGLMPSSTGAPGGSRVGQEMADYPIEGGLFMQVTDRLLTKDYRLSWLDRFPETPVRETMAGVGAPAPSVRLSESLSIRESGNRSNRVKYRCPSCGAQAWGKPSLRLLCGGDDCATVPLDPVE